MSRTQIEITLGIVLVLLTGAFLIVYGLNEPQRMALAEEQEARAIEVGAELFDNNCVPVTARRAKGRRACARRSTTSIANRPKKSPGPAVWRTIVATVSSGGCITARSCIGQQHAPPCPPGLIIMPAHCARTRSATLQLTS
jgi:hypothetical protein